MNKIEAALLQKINSGIVVLNLDGNIVLWNRWMERWTGKQALEVLGDHITGVYPKFAEPYYAAILSDVYAGRSRFCAGAIHKAIFPPELADANKTDYRQNVQFDPLRVNGQNFVLIQVADITEQHFRIIQLQKRIKTAEVARQAAIIAAETPSEDKADNKERDQAVICSNHISSLTPEEQNKQEYQQLIEKIPAGLIYARVVTSSANKLVDVVIETVNSELRKIINSESGSLEENTLETLGNLLDCNPETLQLYWHMLKQGLNIEVDKYLKSVKKWVNIVVYSPDPEHVAAIIQDITERKRFEAERIELLRKTARNERLASIGLLSASISHEINQPLQALKAYVDGMAYFCRRQRGAVSELRESEIEFLSEQIDRIAVKIKYLNSYVESITVNREANFDLNALIEEALASQRDRCAANNIKVEKCLATLPPLNGDAQQFLAVVVHIFRNAIEAVLASGSQEKCIWLTTEMRQQQIVFCCKDNGCGLTKEAKARAFEPFFTTKVATDGMGLGLSISKAIVEGYDGTITLNANKDSAGAYVFVTLPVYS